MKPGAGVRTAFGVTLTAILLVGLAVVTYQNVVRLIEARDRLAHTNDVLDQVNRLMAGLQDAEVAQRDYFLTGSEERRLDFDASREALPVELGRLRELVRDNPAQIGRVTRLESLVSERIRLMQSNVALRREKGLDAVATVLSGSLSRSQAGSIRDVAAQIEGEERQLLQLQGTEAERTARATLIWLALGGALLFLFLGLIWALIRLDLLKRWAAEEESRRGEAELRTTLRSIGDAVLATDAAGRVAFVNPVAERLTGWTESEALGRNVGEIFRIVNEIDGKPGGELVERVLRDGRAVDLGNHMTLLARDGEACPIADSAAPIRGGDGRMLGAVIVFRDIRDKRQADRELQRLASIVSSSGDAIIAEALDTTITAWNAGAEHLFGYTADEVLGKSVAILEPSGDEDSTLSRLARIRQGKRIQQFDTTRMHKDGHLVAVSVSVSPIRDAEGTVVGASKIIRDITERKKAELALRASEERFRVLSDAVTSLVWACDDQGAATYLNRRWSEYTGLDPEDLLGDAWTRAVHPEDLPGCLERWQYSLASGQPYEADLRLRRRDGYYRWYVWRAERIHSESGPLWIATATDIDDLKNTAAALREAKEAAEEASRAKDRFLAVLSHELRTPLTPALATSQLLERRRDISEDVRRSLELIRRNVELETLLVDDLLDLTKISRGTIELRRKPEDLHAVIHRVVDICRSDLLGKRQRLTLDLLAAEHHAEVDPARIQQVFWNLLKNAVKFTPQGGAIAIRSENPEAGRIRISVADNGMGIPAGVLPRIFEPFEQGPRSISPRVGGLGLGLSISRTLVDLHGGRIRAESEGEGKGATLSVELEAFEEKRLTSADDETGRRARPRRPLAILLVEDHADTAGALTQLLREEGHRVKCVASVSEAVDLFRKETFDLLVTDLGLPDGSGHELLGVLRAIRPIRGIVLSGYGMDADVARSRAAGFAEHLTKPVQISLLLAAIDRTGAEG
ncbi:MAG: PAS domain S-box protein [Acidobacteriota bacterium]